MSEGDIFYKAGFSAHGNEITNSKWFEYDDSDTCDEIRNGALGGDSDDDTDNADASKNSDRQRLQLRRRLNYNDETGYVDRRDDKPSKSDVLGGTYSQLYRSLAQVPIQKGLNHPSRDDGDCC
jgi:hypothetical protein